MKIPSLTLSLLSVYLLSACGFGGGSLNHNRMEHNIHEKQASVDVEQEDGNESHGGHGDHAGMNVQTTWHYSHPIPSAHEKTDIAIRIEDAQGQPIEKFDINHEKIMHLIVVSKDLTYFNHIHPAYKGNGQFNLTTQFPTGGDYKLFADFIPSGGEAQTTSESIKVKGKASRKPIVPDMDLTKIVDGKRVTLTFDRKPVVNQPLMMTFHLEVAKTKKPIRNLQPYLGAVGHVVIISADTMQYLHVHPMDATSKGPDAMFHTTFPKSGMYKIWGQFQYEGKVFVVPFVIRI